MKDHATVNWRVEINGKEYGTGFNPNLDSLTNSEISAFIDIVAMQMKETIQKVVNGETDSEVRMRLLTEKMDKTEDTFPELKKKNK